MIDWGAKWFEIRAEKGQSDLATLMYQNQDGQWLRCHFHHREADGFGRIQRLLKDEGLSIPAPIRPLKKPSSLKQVYLLLKGLLIHPKLSHNPWKSFDPNAPSAGIEDVSYWFLSDFENDRLQSKATLQNLNTGFYILSEMDRILRRELYQNPSDSGTWLCPVDVRGAFENPSIDRNWVSFITTTFKGVSSKESIQDAFQQYKKSLKSGDYWAFWELYQIGKYVGIEGMKKLAARAHNKSFWMGSFSDLGVWNQEQLRKSKACNRRWVIGPPGSTSYPIGLTTIEWCGKRSITLKLHPGICQGRHIETAQKVMQTFKAEVLGTEISSSSSEIPRQPGYH